MVLKIILPTLKFLKLSIVFFLTILLLLLGSCTRRESNVEKGNREQVLYLGNGPEPQDLDPQITTGVSEINIYLALFEGLVVPDPMTLEPQPGCAESWKISSDGRTWTFFLRTGLKWSNGDPLTATDFEFAYKRILNPALGAPNASMFYVIDGAEAFHSGKTSSSNSVAVNATDPLTLEIKLRYPVPYFPSLLMHPAWSPLPQKTIESHGGEQKRASSWTRPGNHVSNGPFRLKEWRINESVWVENNPFYWNREIVRLRGVRFHTIENQNTEERTFLAGQLHATESLAPNRAAHYVETKSPFLRQDPYLATYYYLFNTRKPPFDDIRVRQALSAAINREALVSTTTQGGQIPAFHFTPDQTGGYTAKNEVVENTDLARELLADAGFPQGEGFPSFNILINSSESNRMIAEVIQEMWRKNLNIRVGIENQEWKSYLASRAAGDFTVARASWVGDYDDPATFLELFKSDSGNNYSRWNNQEYDRLIDDAALSSGESRHGLFQKAESILLQESPIMPVYFYVTVYLLRPEVKNWFPNRLDWHPYNTVYLEN